MHCTARCQPAARRGRHASQHASRARVSVANGLAEDSLACAAAFGRRGTPDAPPSVSPTPLYLHSRY